MSLAHIIKFLSELQSLTILETTAGTRWDDICIVLFSCVVSILLQWVSLGEYREMIWLLYLDLRMPSKTLSAETTDKVTAVDFTMYNCIDVQSLCGCHNRIKIERRVFSVNFIIQGPAIKPP